MSSTGIRTTTSGSFDEATSNSDSGTSSFRTDLMFWNKMISQLASIESRIWSQLFKLSDTSTTTTIQTGNITEMSRKRICWSNRGSHDVEIERSQHLNLRGNHGPRRGTIGSTCTRRMTFSERSWKRTSNLRMSMQSISSITTLIPSSSSLNRWSTACLSNKELDCRANFKRSILN